MNSLVSPPAPDQLDPEDDQIIAALTRRLAEATRQARALAPRGCAHDFLVPLLRPDLLAPATPAPGGVTGSG